MMKIAMSPAAGALLRALIARARADRNRILLTDAHSTDWQSLTFSGERHRIALRVTGPQFAGNRRSPVRGAGRRRVQHPGAARRRHRARRRARLDSDGAVELVIEALTIAE